MKTEIFDSYGDFLEREDKKINGVDRAFADQNPDFEKQNETNIGCWNCLGCTNISGGYMMRPEAGGDVSMSRDPKSAYYDAGGIETLDVIKAKLTPEQYRGSLLGNVIKYACRLNYKGCAERDAEKLAIYSKELAAIACKQGGECMTIQRYELLDLSSADGPRAMVTEPEEGTYMLHADHVAEVAALKARIAELEEELAASEK